MIKKTEKFEITRLGKEDSTIAQALFLLMQQVFGIENPTIAGESHIKTLLANDHFICFAARHNDELAGGLTAYELATAHDSSSEIFIYDVAVARKFQRNGCGKRLLQSIKEFAKEKRCTLFVDADIEDQHALEFYRATGATEKEVIQFTYKSEI